MTEKRSPALGVSKHIDLTDKEITGVIDHADASVTDAKLATTVGDEPENIFKLPMIGPENEILYFDGTHWRTGTLLYQLTNYEGWFWFNTNWLPSDMIDSAISGTGGMDWDDRYVRLKTGATSGSYARVQKRLGSSIVQNWRKSRYLLARVHISSNTDQNIWIVSGACPTTGNTCTGRHVGFKIIDGTLYGTAANGTTEYTVNLGSVSAGDDIELYAYLVWGHAYFYVDWVYTGGVTLYVSDTTDAEIAFRTNIENTAAADKQIEISDVRVQQLPP